MSFPLPKNLCLIGYSGHAFVVAEALNLSGLEGFFYSDLKEKSLNPYSLLYAGFEGSVDFKWENFSHFALGLGDNKVRLDLSKKIIDLGKELLTVIHPTASIARNATVEKGSFIARNASINPLAKIGAASIVNTSAVVEHECNIGEGVHIAPGAILAGNVQVGKGAFIGANSVVRQGIKIGENAIVGAGSVVVRNIPSNKTYYGNPAKELRK